jgi:hypothetical protein
LKIKIKGIFAIIAFIMAGFGGFLQAQISQGGIPPSTRFNLDKIGITSIILQQPDVENLLREDGFSDKHALPMRFAVSVPANIDFSKQGNWSDLPDGGKVCRLLLNVPNAQALIVYYQKFRIPQGGQLFLYNHDKWQVIGAFTELTNQKGCAFANELIQGEKVTLEYYQPEGVSELPEFVINEVGYVYRTAEYFFGQRGFGGSGACEVNVNCDEGQDWQKQKNSVVRIIVKQGSSQVWCTGSLLNTTRYDNAPYFLTADHCGPTATPTEINQWVFYFNYEGPDCIDPTNDTAFNSKVMVGATKKARSGGAGLESDFKLLLLNESVPLSYNPYFNGWSAKDKPSDSGVSIHHPQGDIRKISTYKTPLVSSNWGGIPNTHWKVVWDETANGYGVTEGGSSGSPIYNSNGQLIGQLTGGDASCANLTGPDYYGKIAYSWATNSSADSTMLKPWLDPDNSGILEIGGGFVGLENENIIESLKVFPNPTTGLFTIDLVNLNKKSVEISVYNVLGEEMLNTGIKDYSDNTPLLDISANQPGIYFITLKSKGEIRTSKILKCK